ncbi:DNA alkylation repair protein [Pseudaestuariivita atlantica]|uniref:DNA alkylation repair protein n=1 Tax=Pseudaestuariivita atlantica TaxID=1317121 RepID=A0A0L1JQE5_9RHOB|nr:DNA alkylation repair protein [Pseudaestuariivita atlantica]KNG93966.1 DNA alkylation repair protein [Pseudaestuariivita atlantica]
MTDTLARIEALGDAQKAAEMAAYHKVTRRYLGVANPVLDDIAREMRQTLTLDDRVAEARALWASDVHEARVLAAKLFTQARIRPDDAVWETIVSWVPDFDAWAVADHACIAGQKRLIADPSRLDTVETWTQADHMWTRRAALVMTLPWTKQNNPKPAELEARDRILGWAAGYVSDPDWFIQKAVAWWLRELSKHDAPRVRAFLDAHGDTMKPFARKEAARKLPMPG